MEQERLRQEAIKQAEKERRDKYKKQEDEREVLRQGIRDKVRLSRQFFGGTHFRSTFSQLIDAFLSPVILVFDNLPTLRTSYEPTN